MELNWNGHLLDISTARIGLSREDGDAIYTAVFTCRSHSNQTPPYQLVTPVGRMNDMARGICDMKERAREILARMVHEAYADTCAITTATTEQDKEFVLALKRIRSL